MKKFIYEVKTLLGKVFKKRTATPMKDKSVEEWEFGSLDITYNQVHSKVALQLSNPHECHKIFLSFWDLGMINFQESFGVLFINTKNHVVGYRM